jgi:hypothetical protein
MVIRLSWPKRLEGEVILYDLHSPPWEQDLQRPVDVPVREDGVAWSKTRL